MNKKLIIIYALVISLVPVSILNAAGYTSPPIPGPFSGDVNSIIITLFNIFWPIAAAFVVIMFVIAGFKFLTAQGEASKVNEARQAVIWGVVGVAVILLAWSIISIVSTQLGV